MENVAATQLPSIQKRRFTTAFQAKDIENAQKQAVPPKTENATKWAIIPMNQTSTSFSCTGKRVNGDMFKSFLQTECNITSSTSTFITSSTSTLSTMLHSAKYWQIQKKSLFIHFSPTYTDVSKTLATLN